MKVRPARRWRVWRPLARSALVVASVSVVGPELVGLARVAPFVAVVAFRPVIAVVELVVAVLTGFFRPQWRPAALAVGGVATAALGVVGKRAVRAGPTPPGGQTLSILSFNVQHGRADIGALAATVRREQPDVVVLPEAGQCFRGKLDTALDGAGYRSWATTALGEPETLGIVVLARAGLGALTATPLNLGSRLRWMRVSGGALGEVDVVAVHTTSPVHGGVHQWATELRMLRSWCAGDNAAHIVVGDVNATLDHAPLRAALTAAQDVAAECGQGLVATWPSALPRWLGVQIDHVFVSGGPRPASFRVLDLPGSDHRALLAEVVLPVPHDEPVRR